MTKLTKRQQTHLDLIYSVPKNPSVTMTRLHLERTINRTSGEYEKREDFRCPDAERANFRRMWGEAEKMTDGPWDPPWDRFVDKIPEFFEHTKYGEHIERAQVASSSIRDGELTLIYQSGEWETFRLNEFKKMWLR